MLNTTRLTRENHHLLLELTDSATTTAKLDFRGWCSGRIIIPSGSSITSLTWYEAEDVDGTYVACYDENGVAVTQTVAASRTYPIPSTLAGSRALRAVANVAGNVYVTLKG